MATRARASFMVRTALLGATLAMVKAAMPLPMVQAQERSTQAADPIATYKEAGADAAQQEKILALASAYERKQEEKAHQVISQIKHLKALSLSPNLDEKTILQTQQGINKLQGEMATEKMRLLINIRKILSPQQRLRLVEILQRNSQQNTEQSSVTR